MSGILTAISSGYAPASGPSYFFSERFEGTGYQNTWTESGTGTIDEDYTTSPLEGSQSLRIAASTQQPITVVTFSSDQAELWGYFRFRINTASFLANKPIFVLRNSSATTVGSITVNTDNGILPTNGTGGGSVTVDKMVTGSNYNIWWHYKKGTGADGIFSCAFSATGTEPTSGNAFQTKTNGNATTDAHDLRVGFGISNTTGEFVIDQILMSTTGTIGNSPA